MKGWTVAFATAMLGITTESRADEATPVIVVVSRDGGPFAGRVCGELQAIGFHVVLRESTQRELPDDTLFVARIVEGPNRRIEIETRRVGGRPDPFVIDASSDDEVSSVQVSERVRAYLQPLADRRLGLRPGAFEVVHEPPRPIVSRPADAPAAAVPPPVIPSPWIAGAPPNPLPASAPALWNRWPQSPPRSASRSWSLGLSAGVTVPLDVGGAGLGAIAAAYVNPIRWLRLSPFVTLPIVATKIDARGGSASLYTGMVGAIVSFAYFDSKPLTLLAGGGYAGVWLRAAGHPDKSFSGQVDDTFTSSLLLHAMGRVHLSPSFALAPQASLGFALPGPDIRFGTASVHHWGLPWGLFALSFETDLIR